MRPISGSVEPFRLKVELTNLGLTQLHCRPYVILAIQYVVNMCACNVNYTMHVMISNKYQLYRVWVLQMTFELVIGFITISTTRNYYHNYLLRCVTFTQLTILHANIPFLMSSHTHLTSSHIHTSRVCLLSRTHSSNWLLKTLVEI
jgi:hypothetical protein